MANETINVNDIKNTVDRLMKDYKRLQLKAMDNDDVNKVYQFTGSMVALEVLLDQLGLDDKEDEEEA